MSVTVLIAPPERLPVLKHRDDFTGALTFQDSDALQALETITQQRPNVIALERTFASTSRGAALINRIKADPTLTACEIRIVTDDGGYAPPGAAAVAAPAVAPAAVADIAPVAVVVEAPATAALDAHGTRRAPRFDIQDGIEVLIDGNPASLIDLSIVGAQVKSVTALRPNQRVRVSLPDPTRPMRFSGSIAWALFEMPKEGARYRAGVEFFGAEPTAVQRFIDANKKA